MNNFDKKIDRFIEFFIEYEGYKTVVEGLQNTLKIAICGLMIGILIGTLIAIVRVLPKYKLLPKVLNGICSFYVAFFRGTPMVVQLLLSYYVALPLMEINIPSVTVALVVFGLNSGAYISEIMRGGIQSVDPGQMEGGRAVGLSFSTTMIKIVIPQAIKNILPTLGNEFIALIKETSVLSFITVTDVFKALKDIAMVDQIYEFVIPYMILGLIYIVLVLIITVMVRIVEKIFARSDRRQEKTKKVKVRS
jgi:polar amino acid transport system permease protein